MTCIAWDGKTLAGDRMTATESGRIGTYRKVEWVRRIGGDQVAVGCCGFEQDAIAFKLWLAQGGEKPKLDEGFAALVVDQRGRIWRYENKLYAARKVGRQAIGSGSLTALGAMYAGSSARHAVWIASRVVCDVGGGIDHVTVK